MLSLLGKLRRHAFVFFAPALLLAALISVTPAAAAVTSSLGSSGSAVTYPQGDGTYVSKFAPEVQGSAAPVGGVVPDGLTNDYNEGGCSISLFASEEACVKLPAQKGKEFKGSPVGYGRFETTGGGSATAEFRDTFDFTRVAEIPVGSQVLEAYFNLGHAYWSSEPRHEVPMTLYGLTTPASTPSWNDSSPKVKWHTAGGDYNATGATTRYIGSSLTEYWEPKQIVQEWVNGSHIAPGRTNDGLILVDTENPRSAEEIEELETGITDETATENLYVLWEPDTTPPTKPGGFIAAFDTSTKVTTVAWQASTDPPFKDGYPGSGVASYSYRYKLGTGSWSSWTSTTPASFTIPSTTEGESISVEAKAIDVAGNVSEIGSATIVSKAPVQAPPASYKCQTATAENKIEAPAPPWQLTGNKPTAQEEALLNSAPQLCPSGQVAVPVTTGTATAPRIPGISSAGQILPSAEGSNGYFYTGDDWQKKTVGMEFGEEIAQPKVSSYADAHSLGQLAVANNPETVEKTVEMGWIVAPSLFSEDSPTSPHLFTYANKDGYKSNGAEGGDCYDCHFVPKYETKVIPGEVLSTTTYSMSMGVQYRNGNWWIWFGDQWIGYINGDFWEGKYTSGQLETDYGEVYDNPKEPTSQMGNGDFGSNSQATTMTAPVLFLSLNQYETTGLHNPPANEETPQDYSIGDINSGRTLWHFGGPGA